MQRNTDTDTPIKRRFVSEIELEQITGVKRRTWQKHRLFGRGPRFYKLQGSVRYDIEEVLAWIRSSVAGGQASDLPARRAGGS